MGQGYESDACRWPGATGLCLAAWRAGQLGSLGGVDGVGGAVVALDCRRRSLVCAVRS